MPNATFSFFIHRAASRIASFGKFAIDLKDRLIDAPKWSLAPGGLASSVWQWVVDPSALGRTNACRFSLICDAGAAALQGTLASDRIS